MISRIENFGQFGSVSIGGDTIAQTPPYIYMAAFTLNYPPHRCTRKLPEIFDTRDFPKKSGFFEENTLGGRPKMKEFLTNFDSTWSGIFFDEKSMKSQWGKYRFLPKMTKFGSKTGKNGPKWSKMAKPA